MTENAHTPDDLDTAIAYHQAGQIEQAERIYEDILSLEPNNTDVLHLLGIAQHQQGNHERACHLLTRAIELKPKNAIYHNSLGEVHRALGQITQAIESYRRAIDLKPAYEDPSLSLGSLLHMQGNLDEAAQCYRRAIENQPRFAAAHFGLGNTLAVQGSVVEAIAAYKEALRIDDSFVEARVNLANTLKALGQLEPAITEYRCALEVDPKSSEALVSLGNALADRGEYTEAIDLYRRALKLDPGLQPALVGLGEVLTWQGKLEEASLAFASSYTQEAARMNINADRISHAFPQEYNNSFKAFATIDNVLNRPEAQRLIDLAEQLRAKHGMLTDARALNQSIRRSVVRQLERTIDTYWIYGRMTERIIELNANIWKFELAGFVEEFQYSEYGPEGHYTWHIDLGNGRNSTRRLSFSVQLSDPDEYEGGELELHYGGERPIAAPRNFGTAIVFPSFLLHRVAPVRQGLRRSLVGWASGLCPLR